MLDIGGRPFIDYQIDLFRRRGIRRIVFCLGYLGQQVETHLGRGTERGMDFAYAYDDDRPAGTGGALRRAWTSSARSSGSATAIPTWTSTTARSSISSRPAGTLD